MSVTPGPEAVSTPEDPKPEPAEARKNEPRDYVVLVRTADKDVFQIHSTVKALSKEDAVRRAYATGTAATAIDADAPGEVTFVAVTARSFQPITVRSEVKTQIVLS